MPDINKVKTCLGLGKAQRKVLEVVFSAQAAVVAHGLAETGEVSIHYGNHLDTAGMCTALLEDGGAQCICCPIAALYALPDESLFELHLASQHNTSVFAGLGPIQEDSRRLIVR